MIRATSIGKTVVAYIEGKMYQKEFDTVEERLEVYEKLANLDENLLKDVQDAIKLFKAPDTAVEAQLRLEFEMAKAESEAQRDILDFMKEVKAKGHQIFEVVENSLYVKGIRISTPELLVREIINTQDKINNPLNYSNGINDTGLLDTIKTGGIERLQGLLNFWKLCALNPDPRARFDLFKFLKNHNLTITPSGHFVAYRTVNKHKEGNSELEKFVTQEYLKVKRWKKSPKNYYVCNTDNGYILGKNINDANSVEELGNLDELYNNIGQLSGNVYTDARTGTFRIKMGEPVTMEREAVDPDPNYSCSHGLHCGNLSFMKDNIGWFGKVGIVVLINPRNVTSVPEYDNGKMRTCEYLPVAIAELDGDGYIKDVELDVLDLEYVQNTQEELEQMKSLSEMELAEYKRSEFIAPEVDFNMLKTILESVTVSIDEANKKIKNRVIKL